jgi:hypothetical protein
MNRAFFIFQTRIYIVIFTTEGTKKHEGFNHSRKGRLSAELAEINSIVNPIEWNRRCLALLEKGIPIVSYTSHVLLVFWLSKIYP